MVQQLPRAERGELGIERALEQEHPVAVHEVELDRHRLAARLDRQQPHRPLGVERPDGVEQERVRLVGCHQPLHRLVELGPAQVVQRHQTVEALLEGVARVLEEDDAAVLLLQPTGALADLVLLRLLAQVEVAADVGVQAGVAELVDDRLDRGGVADELVAEQRGEAGVAGQAGQDDHVDVALELCPQVVDEQGDRLVGPPPEQHAAVVAGVGVEALEHGRSERPAADPAAEQRGEADDGGAVAHHDEVQLAVVALGAEVLPPGRHPRPAEEDVRVGVGVREVGPDAAQVGEPGVVGDDVQREGGHRYTLRAHR